MISNTFRPLLYRKPKISCLFFMLLLWFLTSLSSPAQVRQVAMRYLRNNGRGSHNSGVGQTKRFKGRVVNGATDGATLRSRILRSRMNARSAGDWEVMIEHVIRFHSVS